MKNFSQNLPAGEGSGRFGTIRFWEGPGVWRAGRRMQIPPPGGRDAAAWRVRGLRDAALAGDATAWGALYDEAFAPLDAYVSWRCGGRREWTDEVLQETWLVAVDRLGSFDPARAPFTGWLCGIAANVIRN